MKSPIRFQPKMHHPLLLLLVILVGIPLGLSAQTDYKLAEQDSLALVAFYWATDGPNWLSNQAGFGFNDLSSEWQTTYDGQFNAWFNGPAKDWFGVRVEKRAIENSLDSAYRVTWLWPVIGRRTDGQNMLDGYLPREVGLLTALEQIRINGNDGFRWELVPDELYHPSLQWLDLESCWFGGGLSDEFRNCIDIRKINTRYNYFDYMPNLDFLDEPALRNLNGTQWLYNSRLSFAILEDIIEYFYSISPNPQEFRVEMRDMFDVGDEKEIVAPLGSSVNLVCNDAGDQSAFITYQWFKDGLSRFGKTQKTFSIPSVSAADYGDYKVRITNDYVKTYDLNTNYGEVFTKEIHLVAQAVPPVIENAISSYNGQYLDLYFSKPMSLTGLSAYQDLNVMADGDTLTVLSATVLGRLNKLVRVQLASPIKMGQMIELGYGSAASIEDENGGQLQPIASLSVENRVRATPQLLNASTTLDGCGIELYFDQFMDEETLATGSFLVEGDSSYQVASTTLAPGPIDLHISKKLLLTLTAPVVDTAETITVQYLSGNIAGLYGGTLETGDTVSVLNQISTDRITLRLRFEDGSESLEKLFVSGSWKVAPQAMNDDGLNGDAVANDHIWTYSTQLAASDYTWDVFERNEIQAFDTIQTVDPLTGVVTLTLHPIVINDDSLLSGNILLAFSVNDQTISGDTVYGIYNRDVLFNLHTNNANEDVYLMGIDADWQNGRLMTEVDAGSLYSDTLIKLTAGDVIEYNYRIGNSWENQTPEPRRYVVKNGENIINDQFGVFTELEEDALFSLRLFPNPSRDGHITIEGDYSLARVDVYTMSGQLVRSQLLNGRKQGNIDLVHQSKGLYLLKATATNGLVYTAKIILQ